MSSLIVFLSKYSDFVILGTLLLMSVIMLWKVVERYMYLSKVDVSKYPNIHELDIDLQRNLTTISSIGANAPYVGLLGTVIGILLTFYQTGHQGGDIEASVIMVSLSLALKATALGILVAIPSILFYNGLVRKVEVLRLTWQSLREGTANGSTAPRVPNASSSADKSTGAKG